MFASKTGRAPPGSHGEPQYSEAQDRLKKEIRPKLSESGIIRTTGVETPSTTTSSRAPSVYVGRSGECEENDNNNLDQASLQGLYIGRDWIRLASARFGIGSSKRAKAGVSFVILTVRIILE